MNIEYTMAPQRRLISLLAKFVLTILFVITFRPFAFSNVSGSNLARKAFGGDSTMAVMPPLPDLSITKTGDGTEPNIAGGYRISLPTGITFTEAITVTYNLTGTATSGTDYTIPATAVIPAGQNFVNVIFMVTDDKIIEVTETVIVTLTGGSSATNGPFPVNAANSSATATITDNDNNGTNKVISIVTPAINGTEGAANGSFTVTLPAGVTVAENVTATYTIAGTATNGADYTTLTGSVIIPANQNSVTFPVTITNDQIIEGSETVIVTITGGSSATFGAFTPGTTKTATVTIADDDNIGPNKIISIVKTTDASEPATNGSFTVSLPTGITVKEDVTVNFNLLGSTATSVTDYASIGTSVKILAGNNSATIPVVVTDDGILESNETVIVNFTTFTAATTGPYTADASNKTATVTIADDDNTATKKVISISKTTDGTEGTTNAVFKVSLSNIVTEDVTVNYTVAGTATSGTDYTALAGSVKILAGQSSANITVTITNDNILETTETIILTVTDGTSATFGTYTASTTDNTATAPLNDNDNTIANKVISIVTPAINATEGSANGSFTVKLPTGVMAVEDVTATYNITGTATNGTDYTTLTGSVIIPANQNSVTFPVTVTDDQIIEGNETVIVTITGGSSATFGAFTPGTTKTATVTITDDENILANNKIISIVKTTDASEPATNGSFTVSLPTGITVKEDVTVNFNLLGSTATSVTDYASIGTSVKILAGNNSATIPVVVTDDGILESNETVIVNFTTFTAATTGPYTADASNKTATVTIADDDNTATKKVISISKTTDGTEGTTNAVFKVSLSNIVTEDVTVNYTVAGTAINGTDYTALTGSVKILAGQSSANITVTITNDNIIEPTETIILTVTNGTSATFGTYTASTTDNTATAPLNDNDDVPAKKIIGIVRGLHTGESSADGYFTVSLPANVTVAEDVTVNYTVTGTATNGTDYTVLSGTVIIPANLNKITIPITVTEDIIIENTETVILTLDAASSATFAGYTINATASSASANITDNDNIGPNKIISIVKTTDASEPASSGLFTVSLPAGVTVKEDITVNFTVPASAATPNVDYAAIAGTSVKILAGNNSVTIGVDVYDDAILEGNEAAVVTLASATAPTTGAYSVNATSKTASVIIADDENTAANKVLSIVKDMDAAEPSTDGQVTISLPPGVIAKEDIKINFATPGGTASSGLDYIPFSNLISIPAGQNSVPVTLSVFNDNIIEGDEVANIIITGGTSPNIGAFTASATVNQAAVTIIDDDNIAINKVISIAATTNAGEPGTDGLYTVSLPTGITATEDITVNYTVVGTAIAGADYTALSGTVIIPAGTNTATFALSVMDDKIIEGSETVIAKITGGTSPVYGTYTASTTNNQATITISDDDNITINKIISIFKTTDAAEPATNGLFTVSLPAGITVTEDVTVNYTPTGTATSGIDYTAMTGSVIIPAGQNSATFTLSVIDDSFLEGTETVIATLNGGTSASFGLFPFTGSNSNATVNIADDDNIPANKVISIVKSIDASEPSSGAAFTVSLPSGVTVGEDVTVNYTITGTAVSGLDFTALTGSVKILAGNNSAIITVNIIDDKIIEPTETIIATITGGNSPTVGAYTVNPAKNKATASISDDDNIAANKVIRIVKTNDASEPTTNGNFTISLPAGVSVAEDVEVTYTVSGDAIPGVDYTTLTGTVIIPAGQNSILMPVKIANDKIIENVETVSVNIDGATSLNYSNYTIDALNNNATVNVNDDDNIAANKVISIVKSPDATESVTNGSYTVTLPTGVTLIEDLTVNYTVSGTASAGTDYNTLTGTVIIPAGQNSVVIPVNVIDDKIIENSETVIATITDGSSVTYGTFTASTTAGQATLTITDNDNIAANKIISIVKGTDAAEPATNGSFTVSLPTGVTVKEDITINFTMLGTATNGADYATLTGSVKILAGNNNAVIPVTVINDKTIEGSETFIATVTGGTSASFGAFSASLTNKQATVTISDDDDIAANKVLSIVKTTDAAEPASNGSFTVSLPTGVTVTENITVSYTVAGTAANFDDYAPLPGSVIIPAGQNSIAIDVNVADDNIIEGNETVIATITGATSANYSYTINTVNNATVTITDDDNISANKVVSIVKNADASEPSSNSSYTISLPAGITVIEDVTVNYTVTGTATAGQDYAALAGSVTIPAGQNNATINVYVIDDGVIEGNETVITTLTSATGTAFTFTAGSQATITIADDDVAANKEISINSATNASEPATNGAFTVSLPSGITVTEDIAVTYTVAGTAGSADYTSLTGTVTIPAGQNNATIDVNVINDNIIEGDETVIVTLTGATGTTLSYTINAAPATVIVADDDNTAANKVVSITNTTNASEPGSNGLFTVSLPTGITVTEDITVNYAVTGTAGSTDYTALAGTVTIPAGQNNATIDVNVTDDNIIEGIETVIASLSGATATTFTFTASTQATVTITDNDNTAANKVISIIKTTDASEPATNGLFTVSLPTGITVSENVTINYTIAGTANNTDHSALTGSVIIPAGQNNATIAINITDDTIIEGNETVISTLTGAASSTFTFTANTQATITITDDDDIAASKVISIVKTSDAAEPGTNGRFTVSLPTGVTIGENVTVNYTVAGTAGATDYSALSGSVIISAGQNSATIDVIVTDDNIIEGDETVITTVTGATSANFSFTINAVDNATVTISDDDDISTNKVISIVKTLDAAEPSTHGSFTVSLPTGVTVTEDITVAYSTAGTAGVTDYTALTGTVTIPAGQNSAPIAVNVIDDIAIEGNETVIITLTGAASANLTFTANTQATVTISDNDNTSVVSIVKTTDAAESATNGRYTVSLPAGITIPEDVTVNYTVTGTAGIADYSALSGSVVILAGNNSAIIDVNVTDDKIIEGNETIIANLNTATSATFTFTVDATNNQATVTISDDDNIAANKVINIVKTTDAAEPSANGLFTVSLPTGVTATKNVTIAYTVTGTAAAGTDYSALTGVVIIPAGQNNVGIPVPVINDKIIEGTETVIVTIVGGTAPTYGIFSAGGSSVATVNIADDNTAANKVISIVKTTDAAESSTNGVFTVKLPTGVTVIEDVTVNYTVTGTATAGTDYTALTGSVVIPAGQNSVSVSVNVIDDNLIEGNETVIATLTGATSSNFSYTATAQATVAISDNDNTMQISIVKTTDASEPAGNGSFIVSLPMGLTTTEDVTVNYTVTGTASAGTDYTTLTGSVIIPATLNSAVINVNVIDDSAVEGSETVILTLTGGSSTTFTFTANPAGNKATVTIADNDVAPPVPRVISIVKTADAAEPSTNGNFRVSLDASVTENMTVNYTVTGTATAGTDYTTLTGNVIIPAGQTSASIPVTVIDDSAVEGSETVRVTITGGTSANFTYTVSATNNATLTISDNDVIVIPPAPRVISIVKTSDAAEPSSNGRFTVSLDASVTENMTVNYTVSGTAIAGNDYTALTGSVIIPAGQTSIAIPVNVMDDNAVEGIETVIVTVIGGTSANFTYTVSASKSATVIISDNDNPTVNKEINVYKTKDAAEPFTHGEFMVNVQSVPAVNLTVNYTISGTAQAGRDYQSLSGSVLIPAGSNTINIPMYVTDNLIVDGTRTVVLTITGGVDAAGVVYIPGANNSAIVDITDNDIAVSQFETWKLATIPATDVDGRVRPNELITYTIFVRNTGSVALPTLTVTDAIPANTDYISGGILAGNNVNFTINNLQPGAVSQVSFVVKTYDNLAGITDIRNTAYVSDGTNSQGTYACDPQDGTCTLGTITIVPVRNVLGDLSINKSPVDIQDTYIIGQDISYNIVVKNIGQSAFTRLLVTDELPLELDLPGSYTSDKGIVSLSPLNRKITCTVDQLLPGETVTITITCKMLSGAEIKNVAYVAAAEQEETFENNRVICTVKTNAKDLFFISAFRPGGTINNKFTIIGLEKYPGSRLMVFDSLGGVVYQSGDYQNNWTGQNLPIGTYIYVVDVRKPTGIVTYKGVVTIIK